MSKVSLTNLANLQNETTAVSAINANNVAITAAMSNTLSRDGTSPNQMGADLDMNSNNILNLPSPATDTEPLRKKDLDDFLGVDFNAVVNAETIAVAAAAAAAASEAATEVFASGVPVVAVYATKALANAALAGLAANSVIEVISDESRAGDRDRYKKVAGVYVYLYSLPVVLSDGSYVFYDRITKGRYRATLDNGVWNPRIWPHVYLDTLNGSDANDGFTAPYQTVAKVKAHSMYGVDGFTLGVARGDPAIQRKSFDDLGNYQTLTSYGTGYLPIFDGTDAVLNASFSAHGGGLLNCYDITFTHEDLDAGSILRVWENDKPLKRKISLAATDAAAGTYYYPGDPSTNPLLVTIHPYASDSPIINGKSYELTSRRSAISCTSNSYIQGFYGRRTGGHNGAFRLFETGKANCLLSEEGTTHNCVFGDGDYTDIISVNWTSDEYQDGGITNAWFTTDGAGRDINLTRVGVIVDPSVYGNTITTGNNAVTNPGGLWFNHDAMASVYNSITATDCWHYNVPAGASLVANKVTINNIYAEGTYAVNQGVFDFNGNFATSTNVTINGGLSIGPQRIADNLGPNFTIDGHTYIETVQVSGALFRCSAVMDNTVSITNCAFLLPRALGIQSAAAQIITRNSLLNTLNFRFRNNFAYSSGQPLSVAGATINYDVDKNFYESNYTAGFHINVNGVDKTFAQWQALGNDTNSQEASTNGTTSVSTWYSSLGEPTQTNFDTRPKYNSQMLTVPSLSLTPYVQRPNVPTTLAAAVTYLKTAPVIEVVLPGE